MDDANASGVNAETAVWSILAVSERKEKKKKVCTDCSAEHCLAHPECEKAGNQDDLHTVFCDVPLCGSMRPSSLHHATSKYITLQRRAPS